MLLEVSLRYELADMSSLQLLQRFQFQAILLIKVGFLCIIDRWLLIQLFFSCRIWSSIFPLFDIDIYDRLALPLLDINQSAFRLWDSNDYDQLVFFQDQAVFQFLSTFRIGQHFIYWNSMFTTGQCYYYITPTFKIS